MADALAVSALVLLMSSSNRARTVSSGMFFAATACIWVRLGRLPSRHVPGSCPSCARRVEVVKPVARLRPSGEALFEFDLVRASGAEKPKQVARLCGLADRLRMQEGRDDRLFNFPVFQSNRLHLNPPGLGEFVVQDAGPGLLLALPFLGVGHGHHFPQGLRESFLVRGGQEDGRPDQRARIPRLGLAQRQRERPQDTVLFEGEDVMISGFGKWSVKSKHARRGRNPQTGEELILDARKVVTWQYSPVLKKAVNK